MLLLAIEPYEGGEHACDLLIVSVSVIMQNSEKIGSTPRFYGCADPDVIEFRWFHLPMPRVAWF